MVEVRVVEGEVEINTDKVPYKVDSPPSPVAETSNPTRQIRGVLDDLNREEKEVTMPLRVQVNIDDECALPVQLEE